MPERHDVLQGDFKQLFINNVPLLDVRAPVEFERGAFPGAKNLPLLDNAQRELIGKVYADDGQQAAIAKGNSLATADIRAERLEAWLQFANTFPQGYLYCFRGGLRSHIAQQWLADAGCKYPLVSGGYKALRAYLLTVLERLANAETGTGIILLAGATASGKTDLIQQWPQSLDLEGRANHRGSAFGATFSPQPAQIDFENVLASDWLKCEVSAAQPVLVEAESRLVGRLNVPLPLQATMQHAPVIELQCSREQRLTRLRRDYIEFALQCLQQNEADPWPALHSYILGALDRIQKRLGGVHHKMLVDLLPDAIIALRDQNSWIGFDSMFECLLDHYYDKMYSYQLGQQQDRIVFRGEHDAVLEWLSSDGLAEPSQNSIPGAHA